MKKFIFLILFIPSIIFGQNNDSVVSQKIVKAQQDSISEFDANKRLDSIQNLRMVNPILAIELCKESCFLADSLRNESLKAKILNEEGLCYLSLNVFDESFKKFIEAKTIFEKEHDSQNLAKVLSNLGMLHIQSDDFDLSLEFFVAANLILMSSSNDIDLAYNQMSIAELFFLKGDYARALDFYLVSQIVWENEKMLVQQADAKVGMGKVFRQTGRNSEAEKNFLEAEKIYMENNAEPNLAKLNNEIAEYRFFVNNNAVEALERLKKSETVLLDKKMEKEFLINCKLQQNILKSMSRFEEALSYSEKFENVQSAKFDEKKNQVLSELQMRYRTKELENENIDLRLQLKENHEKKERCHRITFGVVAVFVIIWFVINYRRKKLRK